MKVVKINKENWNEGFEKLKESYKLFIPAKNEKFYSFTLADKEKSPDFNYLNTRLSPKSIIFPQSETMFEYSLDEQNKNYNIIKESNKDYPNVAVIGIRPCDAKAFLIVKRNFDTPEYQDTYWLKAYEASVFIGLACQNPCATCFCTSSGCGPFNEEGLDILLIENEDNFFAKIITKKGENLIESFSYEEYVEADKQIASMKETAEAKITSFIETDKLKGKTTAELFDAPFWEEIAFACINCGTCTYLCPTCWCFDIQDEVKGMAGARIRNWDSCMYPLFTLHGSGHNPRSSKTQRVRQRFMHKFKYYVDKYNEGIQCVGCGRCVQFCPVNIDIRKICAMMNNHSN